MLTATPVADRDSGGQWYTNGMRDEWHSFLEQWTITREFPDKTTKQEGKMLILPNETQCRDIIPLGLCN